MLREGYRCSNTGQTGNRRGEVRESRMLTRELEAPAMVRDEPDAGGRKETAEVDGDALKLTILEPRARIRHRENRIERPGLNLLGGVSGALRSYGCLDDAERSSVGVVGRPGQKDLPGREDEISGDFVETEPRNHQENAFLAHRHPLSRVGCEPAARQYRVRGRAQARPFGELGHGASGNPVDETFPAIAVEPPSHANGGVSRWVDVGIETFGQSLNRCRTTGSDAPAGSLRTP